MQVRIKRYISKKEASKYVKKEEKRREKKEQARRKSSDDSPNMRRKKRRDEDNDEDENEEDRGKVKPPLYEECVFPCNEWLANDEGDGLVKKELKSASNILRFREGEEGESLRNTDDKLEIYHFKHLFGFAFRS